MIVQKYGGTSLGTANRLINVANIIRNYNKEHSIIAVVSAISSYVKSEGTTSKLLEAANLSINNKDYSHIINSIRDHHLSIIDDSVSNSLIKDEVRSFVLGLLDKLTQFLDALTIIKELSPRSSDRVIRVGEKLSAYILCGILRSMEINAVFVDLSSIAPKDYSVPTPTFYKLLENNLADRVKPIIKAKNLAVVTGFMGEIPNGIINSIGRGYTDYTASILAANLKAVELQIWKEVDGIFTTDPNLISEARVLTSITPKEAAELTYFGSEVIHPFTMEKVAKVDVPIRIKNTFKPELNGTLITDDNRDNRLVKAITAKKNITILNICSNRMLMAYGFMAKVFNIFEKHGIIIDLISTSEVNISLTIEKSDRMNELIEDLSRLGEVTFSHDNAILSMVGQGMRSTIGLAGRMFSCLADNKINIDMISQGASEINISCVVKNHYADKAVRALHEKFITSNVK